MQRYETHHSLSYLGKQNILMKAVWLSWIYIDQCFRALHYVALGTIAPHNFARLQNTLLKVVIIALYLRQILRMWFSELRHSAIW
jgi:hypothetical protein